MVVSDRFPISLSASETFRIGFVPLVDCAPLVVASELGLFQKYGVSVALAKQPGWATVRDKLVYGELDGAHALSGLLFALANGIGCLKKPCLTGLLLNTHGDGITLSNQLWEEGVRSGEDIKPLLESKRGLGPLVFGAVHPFSTHHLVLRQWLQKVGLKNEEHVHIVVVPPMLMARSLASGHLDGYCVGEPWNTQAILEGNGWLLHATSEVFPMHPEKAFVLKEEHYRDHPADCAAMGAAILEACQLCDDPDFRKKEMVSLLSRQEYLNCPAEWIANSLFSPVFCGQGHSRDIPGFHLFHGGSINRPSKEQSFWLNQQLSRYEVLPTEHPAPTRPASLFREELYEESVGLLKVAA
ncbi:MAG: CmpA/NrtA family ABC transporter substrate-binding protein [Verrucomicrobiota bacterium]